MLKHIFYLNLNEDKLTQPQRINFFKTFSLGFSASLLCLLFLSCSDQSAEKKEGVISSRAKEQNEIADEARGGSLKDPGGAKELREETDDARREQMEQIREIDRQ